MPPRWSEEPLAQRNVVDFLRGIIEREPLEGCRVIDATAGNGHDTVLLAEQVGPHGLVLAIDLQPAAVAATRAHLESHPALSSRVTVQLGNHSDMSALTPSGWQGDVALIVFNLGYLPGGGRDLTTLAVSSVQAANSALELLRPGGLLTLAIYTGHPTGVAEATALRGWAGQLPHAMADVHLIRDVGDGTVGRPEVLLVRRLPR